MNTRHTATEPGPTHAGQPPTQHAGPSADGITPTLLPQGSAQAVP